MAERKRIGALYSRGPHFGRMLAYLRKQWPDAEITALAPPGYLRGSTEKLADEFVEIGQSRYGFRDVAALRELVRQIRGARFDVFVTMFASTKLRLLASRSNAAERFVFTPDGRLLPLRLALVRRFLGGLGRRVRGQVTYAWIYCVVRCQSAKCEFTQDDAGGNEGE